MAISDAQRAARAGRIGSSDATRIMAGDWLALWREKTGRADPANLDLVAAVQIGIATEHLHPRFVEKATGVRCVPAEETWVHPERDWMLAHPDFLTWEDGERETAPDTIVEAKFTGSFQSDAELAQRYHWQLQHQLTVLGLDRGLLSILRPNGHAIVRVRRVEADCDHLLETLSAFWWHVANDVEPTDPLPFDGPAYETRRVVDMARHNRFVSLAAVLVEQRSAALAVKEAEVALKALMPADARIAFFAGEEPGRGLYVARDREGRLSLRYGAPPRRALDSAEPWTPTDGVNGVSPDPSLDAVLSGGWGEGRDERF
ncbi:YqaJ viral recombinase family protein [Azospirillum sp. sgz302134]